MSPQLAPHARLLRPRLPQRYESEEFPRDRVNGAGSWRAIESHATPRLRLVIAGLYFTDQRIGNVLKIDERDLIENGIYVKQQKTGKELVVGWNDDLRAWVQECRAAHGKVVELSSNLRAAGKRPLPLLRWPTLARARAQLQHVRKRWRRGCTPTRWPRLQCTEAKRQGHDPQKLLGHEDARTTKIYLRGRETEAVQGPSIRRLIDKSG